MLRMNTPGSLEWSCIRTRSPKSAPPVNGLLGSTATTPTVLPPRRSDAVQTSTSVLLPTPGGPVTPIRYARPARGCSARSTAWPSGSPSSTNEMSRASACVDPANASFRRTLMFIVRSTRSTRSPQSPQSTQSQSPHILGDSHERTRTPADPNAGDREDWEDWSLDGRRRLIHAKNGTEGVANFADGRIRLHRRQDVGHQVLGASRGPAQSHQRALRLVVVACAARLRQARLLPRQDFRRGAQDRRVPSLIRVEPVDTHADLPACLDASGLP